jgi:peptidyl-prolyl cis-trans isomerase C
MMVPEFDKVVFSAPVNAVQGPVQTQFGYHLIEVTSRDE